MTLSDLTPLFTTGSVLLYALFIIGATIGISVTFVTLALRRGSGIAKLK